MVSLTAKFEGRPFDHGAQTEVGWCLTSRCYISEMVRDRAQVTLLITNRKSYMCFRLQQRSLTSIHCSSLSVMRAVIKRMRLDR